MTEKVISLNIAPGIQRDGTLFDAPSFVDGRWVRFQRGRPRKMGGYNGMFLNASNISRGMIMTAQDGLNYIISGYQSGIEQWVTDNNNGVGTGPTQILPYDFSPDPRNLWQFDFGYDTTLSNQFLIAHPGLNLVNIDNTINTQVLYGAFPGNVMSGIVDSDGSNPTNLPVSVSGGCVLLYPYLFVYGNNGLIKNCSAGNFLDWNSPDSNENNACATKIVKGLPVRGGTTSPAGLFWSLDSLIRVTFTGDSQFYWRYDTVTAQSSILSSQSVIEYDGLFFWCGVDRFLMYNGVVQEIPNQMNINWFFDNLNYAQRQKVWASKIPRWGEIWWFYPRGDSSECDDAIVYNIREQTWYDAGQAIGARRSAGAFSEVFRRPVWAGTEPVANSDVDVFLAQEDDFLILQENGDPIETEGVGRYTIWQHEFGSNEIYLSNVNAIQSYFETNNIGLVTGGPGTNERIGTNRWIRVERLEPDFVQSGPMNLYVTGKGYADASDVTTGPYTFTDQTLKIDLREQRREMRLRFESNTQNGDYQVGKILLSVDAGDERSTGNP